MSYYGRMDQAEKDVSHEALRVGQTYGNLVLRDHAVGRHREFLVYARAFEHTQREHGETYYAQRCAYLWGQVSTGRWP